jgi:hypothetical protein
MLANFFLNTYHVSDSVVNFYLILKTNLGD